MLGTFLLPNSRLTGGVPLIGILVVHGKGAKMPAGNGRASPELGQETMA